MKTPGQVLFELMWKNTISEDGWDHPQMNRAHYERIAAEFSATLARRVEELEGLLREIEGSNWNCPLQDCYGEDHQHDAHCRLRAALAPRDEARRVCNVCGNKL